jgi:hypothetical protein
LSERRLASGDQPATHSRPGYAPRPFGRYCTPAKCKYGSGRFKNVVELAEEGDWIAGTGGVD